MPLLSLPFSECRDCMLAQIYPGARSLAFYLFIYFFYSASIFLTLFVWIFACSLVVSCTTQLEMVASFVLQKRATLLCSGKEWPQRSGDACRGPTRDQRKDGGGWESSEIKRDWARGQVKKMKWGHGGAGWLLRCSHQRNALFPPLGARFTCMSAENNFRLSAGMNQNSGGDVFCMRWDAGVNPVVGCSSNYWGGHRDGNAGCIPSPLPPVWMVWLPRLDTKQQA